MTAHHTTADGMHYATSDDPAIRETLEKAVEEMRNRPQPLLIPPEYEPPRVSVARDVLNVFGHGRIEGATDDEAAAYAAALAILTRYMRGETLP